MAHPTPDPTYLDNFGLLLASRLIGTDKLEHELKLAAGEATAISSSPEPSGPAAPSPRRRHRRRGRHKNNPLQHPPMKPIQLYWRTPLLLHQSHNRCLGTKEEGEEAQHEQRHENNNIEINDKVLFMDVTFGFCLPQSSSSSSSSSSPTSASSSSPASASSSSSSSQSIIPPCVQVQFGTLIQTTQTSLPVHNSSEGQAEKHVAKSAKYIRGAPLTHSDLFLHAQQVGIDLEGTTSYALANLMAGALLCSSSRSTSFVTCDGDRSTGRRDGILKGRGGECAVKLSLSYDDLGGEAGELLIRSVASPSNGQRDQPNNNHDAGLIGGMALDMILINLEHQDNCNDCCGDLMSISEADGMNDVGGQQMATKDCAVNDAFRLWWDNGYNRIAFGCEMKNKADNKNQMDEYPKSSLQTNTAAGSSNNDLKVNKERTSLSSSPQHAEKTSARIKGAEGICGGKKKDQLDREEEMENLPLTPQSRTSSNTANMKYEQCATTENPLQHKKKMTTPNKLSIETASDTTTSISVTTNNNNEQIQKQSTETKSAVNSTNRDATAPFSLSASLPPLSPSLRMGGKRKRKKTFASRHHGQNGNSVGGGISKRRKRGRITIGG